MTTWGNLFTGYDPFKDVFTNYPSLYAQAANSGGIIDLWHQFIVNLPFDIRLTFEIFYSSLIPIVLFAALFFVFLKPIFQRTQSW